MNLPKNKGGGSGKAEEVKQKKREKNSIHYSSKKKNV
jgi:hypothetical protein